MIVGIHAPKVDTHEAGVQSRGEAVAHMTHARLCLQTKSEGDSKRGRECVAVR